ncbi:DUF3159 domain-containing protein [Mycobacterium sp. 1274756.6]|uniref:DUF3159 domain-containing protein n=1 Tax=Mycobacterium sp. 1274756.6 TaxID=1834076 RepID=UPI0007FF56CC|nr:DUF3159 domain-containing protein [Mycobacterium sp. 1274756.6]OBJ71323.1 hypothetical protein A5643_08080 [Mycobacterium sp. 1274756.6]
MSDNTQGYQRILDQIGGVRGVIYSSLPVLVFVPVSSLFGLMAAVVAALGTAAAVLVWRLIRRQSTQPAISGFFGVAICVLIAYLTGESRGYFLLGIVMSLFWAIVFAASILIRRPVVGYLWSWAGGHDRGWRAVPAAVYLFDLATATWVLVFGSRFAVQAALFNADQTGWLAAAKIGMGWPLTALAAVVTYLVIKAVQRRLTAAPVAEPVGEVGSLGG